jgi:hypothetical protein
MRKWVYESVVACDKPEGWGNRVFSSGSVDQPDGDSPQRPFIVIRLSTAATPLAGTQIKQQNFQVWMHRVPGSMLNVDELALNMERHMEAAAPAQVTGFNIMECSWQFTSEDQYDDHFKTSTRFAAFLATYKAL